MDGVGLLWSRVTVCEWSRVIVDGVGLLCVDGVGLLWSRVTVCGWSRVIVDRVGLLWME